MIVVAVICLLSSVVPSAFACNGYEVKDFKINICDNQNDVVGLENFSARLNDECNVVPSGCVIIKKTISRGNGTYTVEKKAKMGMPVKFSGKKDICETLEKSNDNSDVSLVFKMMGMKQKCPIEAGKLCGDGVMSVDKYKDKLKMAEGEFEGIVRGSTDAGDVCLQISATVAKKGGGGGFPTMG